MTARAGLIHLLTNTGWTPPTETPCHAGRNTEDHWCDEAHVKNHTPNTARQLCSPCPYTGPAGPCLKAALNYEAQDGIHRGGIWGGTTPEMRAQLGGDAA